MGVIMAFDFPGTLVTRRRFPLVGQSCGNRSEKYYRKPPLYPWACGLAWFQTSLCRVRSFSSACRHNEVFPYQDDPLGDGWDRFLILLATPCSLFGSHCFDDPISFISCVQLCALLFFQRLHCSRL